MAALLSRKSICTALLIALGGCDRDAEAPAGEPRAESGGGLCQVANRMIPLPEGLGESSGLAPSHRTPGVFWTHNDSGGDPAVYAFGLDGRIMGTVTVTGARNRDWEDMAVGPCAAAGGSCLYLADIGNNAGRRRDPIVLYRVPEPAPGDAATAPAERFEAHFPGERHDAEAMFVLPDGRVYLVSKGTGRRAPVELFRWPTPLQAGAVATLERVRTLAPPPRQPGDEVTGASASPDGRWVAVRTYSTLALFPADSITGTGGAALQMDLLPLGESQGEAVALGDDGSVVLTSEGGGASLPGNAALLRCTLP
ncbi:MAG TPA: hypothetical protein VHG91_02245 [Longimicrobium sp.]|nr:hypothetical protein [Longimicrobium sp.]